MLPHEGQSTPRRLAKIVEKSDLARSTVMLHPEHLEKDPLVTRRDILLLSF